MPLPPEVCNNLALAVSYSNNLLPEYNEDTLRVRDSNNRVRRAQRQRLRRAAKRIGASPPSVRRRYSHIASQKNSTIHVVTGAMLVRKWTGAWHFRKQIEILKIMGLYKGEDFIRDRIRYLQVSNSSAFKNVQMLTDAVKKHRRGS